MRRSIIFLSLLLLLSLRISFGSPTAIESSLNRENVKDEKGQSLSEKIRLASRAYLELNFSEAESQIQSAIQLILKSPPYSSLKADLSQIASLVVVIDEENPKENPLIDAFPFRYEINFQKNISERLKDRLLEASRPNVLLTGISGAKEIYLSGESIQLPFETPAGTYLAHIQTQEGLKSGWLKLSPSKNPQFIEEQKIAYQRRDFPIEKVETKTPSPNLVMSSQPGSSNLSRSNLWLQSQLATNSRIDPTDLDMNSKPWTNEPSPFYKKTWFWMLVGVAAGVGGYVTYQTTRSPTVIKTP